MKTKITNLRIENGCYYWTMIDGFATDRDGQPVVTECRTNSSGEGIWHNERNGWKQNTGTCQFSLAGKSISAARAKLNRDLNS